MKPYQYLLLMCICVAICKPYTCTAGNNDSAFIKALFISFNIGGDKAYWNGPHSIILGPEHHGLLATDASVSFFFRKYNYLEFIYIEEDQIIPNTVRGTFFGDEYLSNTNQIHSVLYGKGIQLWRFLMCIGAGVSYTKTSELNNIQSHSSGGWFMSNTTYTYDEVHSKSIDWLVKTKLVYSFSRLMAFNAEVYTMNNKMGLHTNLVLGVSIGLLRRNKL